MIQITNECNMELMSRIETESIDIICIDPPYKYLKNQKLEVDFDELKFFTEAKRVLIKDGFIIMFGRGVSFYRWNCMLSDMGFIFKEEIVWNKGYNSSPVTPINRYHETISIWSEKGKINKTLVPYIETKVDFNKIHTDLKRIKSALQNPFELLDLEAYIKTGEVDFQEKNKTQGHGTTVQSKMKQQSKATKTMQALTKGMKEQSIINVNREHYTAIHPTQKPVRLLERLLLLCLPDKPKELIKVADFFGGSMSVMEACINLGLNGISCEIDKEYFDAAMKRINNHMSQQKLSL